MYSKDIINKTALELKVNDKQVEVVLDLLQEGATVPFIARYRKQLTGNLDENQIQAISNVYEYQENLAKRKEAILKILEQKGLLTDELNTLINQCQKLSELENIYKPYKDGKKTKANVAIALGLKPLAEWMLEQRFQPSLEEEAKKYITKDVTTIEQAIAGARDIIAEIVANNKEIRDTLKESIMKFGFITSKLKPKAEDEHETFKVYYDFKNKISYLSSYKVMALNRGENKSILSVKLDYDEQFAIKKAYYKYAKKDQAVAHEDLIKAINDSFKRLLIPSIENEVRNDLTEVAEKESIERFAHNVEQLLLQNPIKGKTILGWDPGFVSGCKLAIIDPNNNVLKIDVVHPFDLKRPDRIKQAELTVSNYIKEFKVDIIAIGNGTASRESEAFISELIKEKQLNCQYCIVSEAGASVYSASELAQEEFPDLTVEKRSAISIARRIIDPLSELIKIPTISIGVGQYQHDVDKKALNNKLTFVVEKVVNNIGVNANTASYVLLQEISGLSKAVAKNIVAYREKHGSIKTRKELLEIKGLSEKVFEQCSGFLRILGSEPLDKTNIHPESYDIAKQILVDYQLTTDDIGTDNAMKALSGVNCSDLANKYQSDEFTIKDIIESLKAKLLDYRESYPQPILKSEILSIENLYPDLILQGTVRNILDFGAFIDIGIKESALLHISQMTNDKNKTPYDILDINQIIQVKILSIDTKNKKIQVGLIA